MHNRTHAQLESKIHTPSYPRIHAQLHTHKHSHNHTNKYMRNYTHKQPHNHMHTQRNTRTITHSQAHTQTRTHTHAHTQGRLHIWTNPQLYTLSHIHAHTDIHWGTRWLHDACYLVYTFCSTLSPSSRRLNEWRSCYEIFLPTATPLQSVNIKWQHWLFSYFSVILFENLIYCCSESVQPSSLSFPVQIIKIANLYRMAIKNDIKNKTRTTKR